LIFLCLIKAHQVLNLDVNIDKIFRLERNDVADGIADVAEVCLWQTLVAILRLAGRKRETFEVFVILQQDTLRTNYGATVTLAVDYLNSETGPDVDTNCAFIASVQRDRAGRGVLGATIQR